MALDTVRVSVTRDTARSPLTLPFAITALLPDSARPGQKRISLDEAMLMVPGVFAANRQNPSQDPRISIRGFGSRSAFGVRGIRVLWNGIPLTVADGQTPVDYIDLDAVDRIEVIRGSASALFGNSSGGVISLSSSDTTRQIALKRVEENGALRKVSARTNLSSHGMLVSAGINRTSGQGYRDYSHVNATRASGSLSGNALGQQWSLNVATLDMPLAENPGSITLAQMNSNARLADALSVRKGASKSVNQKQVGLGTSRLIGRAELSGTVFGGTRALGNPLTFATVDLNRTSGGASARGALPFVIAGLRASANVGFDTQVQNDDRHELENCTDIPSPPLSARCPNAGKATGAIRRNQRELVRSDGAFVKAEFAVGPQVLFSIAARHDVLRFTVRDRMPVPDALKQSGERHMSATTPMIGLVYKFRSSGSVYVNASTAFETPTVTELANKPDGSTGLNGALNPQISRTVEVGVKGFLMSGLRYDIAGFRTGVQDELIPFEIPGGAGRRFYRNAGHTNRSGIEASTLASAGLVDFAAAYSLSRFRFDEYTVGTVSYTGKTIPGIPVSKLDAAVTVRPARSFMTAEATASSSVFVDDLNTAKAPGYALFNVRAGITIPAGSFSFRPVIGVNNVTNRLYSASVNINAAGGKYYEPGSERLLYGMVEIKSRF